MKQHKLRLILHLYFCLELGRLVCSDSKLAAEGKNYFRHFIRWAVASTGKIRNEYEILARKCQRKGVAGCINRVKRLVAGFRPRRSRFELMSGHEEFVVNKVAPARFSPTTSASPPNYRSTYCSPIISHPIIGHYTYILNNDSVNK
jgi:hypothetical protein